MYSLDLLGRIDFRDAGGAEARGIIAQPKRLALLAYLAVAGTRGPVRRDRLLATFWPELDQERARKALNKAVHYLRQELGDDAILSRGAEELAVNPARVRCDAVRLLSAADKRECATVLELYQGELLPSFYIEGAPEFERWLDDTRAELRRHAGSASRLLAHEYECNGRFADAVACARRSVELLEDDEQEVRHFLELLGRLGDRAGALRAYEEFRNRVRKEFGAEPAAETRRLIERIRVDEPIEQRAPAPGSTETQPMPAPPAVRAPHVKRRVRPGIALATVAVALAVLAWSRRSAGFLPDVLGLPGKQPLRAFVADVAGSAADSLLRNVVRERVNAALIDNGIATLPDAEVADARAASLLVDTASLTSERAQLVAYRKRVPVVVEARVSRAGDKYSLVTNGINVRDGRVLASEATSATAASLTDSVSRLTARLARSLASVQVSLPPITGFTAATSSLTAYRHFMEADVLNASGGPDAELSRHLHEAVRADSGFAMAWDALGVYFHRTPRRDSMRIAYDEALRHGGRLTRAERLYTEAMMQYRWGTADSALRLFDASLMEDPRNPQAFHDRGMALRILGRPDDAAESFQRAIELTGVDASDEWLNSLATTLAVNGSVDSARVVARRIRHADVRSDAELYVALGAADWGAARRIAQGLVSEPTNDPIYRARMAHVVASTYAAHGQLSLARERLVAARAIAPLPIDEEIARLMLDLGAEVLSRNSAARGVTDSTWWQPFFRGMRLGLAGAPDRAKAELAAVRRFVTDTSGYVARQMPTLACLTISGDSGLRKRIDVLAPSASTGVHRYMFTVALNRYIVADAYERLDRLDSAAAYFDLLANPRKLNFVQAEKSGFSHTFALRRLARLYDRMGRSDDAQRYWKRFLAEVDEPDPELRGMVEEARAAINERSWTHGLWTAFLPRSHARSDAHDAMSVWVIPADIQSGQDSSVGIAVRELVKSVLDASHSIHTLSADQLTLARRAALMSDTERLDVVHARHLALRTSVPFVIEGRVDRVGDAYDIILRAVRASDGGTETSVSDVVTNASILATTRELATRLADGISARPATSSTVDSGASTSSFEAYRRYALAMHYTHDPSGTQRRRLLREAVALDSNFAAAWAKLGWIYRQQGIMDSARIAYARARATSDRLTRRERFAFEAEMARDVENDGERAMQWSDSVIADDSAYAPAYRNRAVAAWDIGRYDEAVRSCLRSIDLSPRFAREGYVMDCVKTLAPVGRIDDAVRISGELRGDLSKNAAVHIAVARNDWPTVQRIVMADFTTPLGVSHWTWEVLASAQAASGRVNEAAKSLDQAKRGFFYPGAQSLLQLLLGEATGQPATRFPLPEGFQDGVATPQRSGTMPVEANRILFPMWAAWRGDTARARRELAQWSNGRIALPFSRVDVAMAAAWVESCEHHWDRIPRLLGPDASAGVVGYVGGWFGSLVLRRWLVADAYEHMGRPDSAVAYFEMITQPVRSTWVQAYARGLAYPFALRREALLYEGMKKPDVARARWLEFVHAFTKPDTDLAPMLDQARARLNGGSWLARLFAGI